MEHSTILSLPYLAASQDQKHITHNEALQKLDVLTQLTVASASLSAPPASPTEGERHIIAPSATDAWVGKDSQIAAFQNGAWAYFAPQEGWRVWICDEDSFMCWDGSDWALAGGDTTEIQNANHVGINATADDTNRLALSSPASLFNHAGAGHQIKVTKASAGATNSLLFQTNWSGRAEMGLAGDDDFSIKVSANGSSWRNALKTEKASGHVLAENGIGSVHLTVPENAVGYILPPKVGGLVMITVVDPLYPQAQHSGIFAYDVGPSMGLYSVALTPDVNNLGVTNMTGTSGTAGKTSVAADNSAGHRLAIENRIGDTRTYSLTFIGGELD